MNRWLPMIAIVAGTLTGGAARGAAVARHQAPGSTAACDAGAMDDPEGARLRVMARLGGREAASQPDLAECLARADALLGLWDEAGALFDGLAAHLGGEAGMAAHAATLAGEGAQSWLAAHQPKRACASAATARHLAADDPALRLLEARVALTCDRVALALSDLAAPFDEPSLEGQALIVRAQALRMAGHPDQAAALADESLRRHADDPAALLERGIDRAQAGSLRAARADWERVLEIAPDAPEANLARQDLSVMDADPDRSDAAQ